MRMSHVLSLLLADRKLVSFPALSFDSIEPEGCSDIKLGAYGKYALSIVTPKAIISAATSIVERRLPCWLYIREVIGLEPADPTEDTGVRAS